MNISSIGELKSDAPLCCLGNIKAVIPHQSVGQTKSHAYELLRKYRMFKAKKAKYLDSYINSQRSNEGNEDLNDHDRFKANLVDNPSARADVIENEYQYNQQGNSYGSVEELGRGQPNMSRRSYKIKRSQIM